MKMWLVFSGDTDIPWLRWLLKRGFRHCYAIMHDGSKWITCDPLAHKLDLGVHHHLPGSFDLPRWLKDRGLQVVPVTPQAVVKKPLAPAFFTCVETVKRLTGLRKWHIWTPYQLFKHLEGSNHAPLETKTHALFGDEALLWDH